MITFFKTSFTIATLCTLQCVHAKSVGSQQSTTSTSPQQPSYTQPQTSYQPIQPSYTPIPQAQYTTIFNMLQATQPSTADYTMLMNIKNEAERQIKTIPTAPTKIISSQPSQQPQQSLQSRVAARRANKTNMDVEPWSSRDQYWIDEVWNSLTQSEKMELYNEKPEYVRWFAATFDTPLAQKLRKWLTENKISF